MKKTTVDNISLILLLISIVMAVLIPTILWILILCLVLGVAVLILNLIGYFTKYTEEEQKGCRKSLFLLVAASLFIACLILFKS